jgi:hypothetical protein
MNPFRTAYQHTAFHSRSPSADGSIDHRRCRGLTIVNAVAMLLVVLGSLSLPATLAVLLMLPALLGITTIVIVALAPLFRAPRLQIIILLRLQFPWLGVAETKLTRGLVGNMSITVTSVASEGPLLVMVMM